MLRRKISYAVLFTPEKSSTFFRHRSDLQSVAVYCPNAGVGPGTNGPPFEIIVIGDSCTDDSEQVVRQKFSRAIPERFGTDGNVNLHDGRLQNLPAETGKS